MLPGFLESTYKKYKNDTSIFVKWLCEAGSKCGYAISTAQTVKEEPAAKGPRLKGKARKEAKQAINSQASGSLKPVPSEARIVSLKELLPLAQAIVNSKNPMSIPSDIMRAGFRAVSARKKCAGYFKNNTDPRDAKTARANQGHSYFISLMEEVIMALQPCFALSAGAEQTAKPDSKTTGYSIEDLENKFAALEVEEPIERSDDAQPINSKAPETFYELELPKNKENAEAEKLFALFCLFDDFQNLRTFVADLWTGYGAGRVDLITASVTTNAAFQLALRTQEEMQTAYPECGDYQSVLGLLMTMFSKPTGQTDEIEVDDRIVKWMFAPAHQILDSFCDVLIPNQVPLMKRGHFGVYNPGLDRDKMSDMQQQSQDLILFMELLPEFAFIERYRAPLVASDELTRGLIKMIESKNIPIWLTFATTVLLDIHHTLKDKADLGFKQLQAIGRRASGTLSRYQEFSQNITSPSTWPTSNANIIRELARGINDGILKDQIFPIKDKQYKKKNSLYSPETERFYLYKRHPILCGILAFRILLEMDHAGNTLCNAWGTAIYPAHFYNALKQKANPVKPWPMMDQLISIHTEERLFLGAAPKTIVDCHKQISLILGYSASSYAANRRHNKMIVSKNGPRGLKETSVLGEIFHEGLAADSNGNISFTLHNIEALLNEQAAATSKIKKRFNKTHRLTSLELLTALSTAIPLELPNLRFDYFAMHEQSITLLRRLQKELDPELRKYVGPGYIENESQLPFVALYVVMIACGSFKAAEAVEMDGEAVNSRLLEKAGEILDGFIEELGKD